MIESNPNDAEAYYYRGMVWLQLQNWGAAKTDLIAARDLGFNINTTFHDDYESIADFEQKNGVKVQEDIAAMLTQ